MHRADFKSRWWMLCGACFSLMACGGSTAPPEVAPAPEPAPAAAPAPEPAPVEAPAATESGPAEAPAAEPAADPFAPRNVRFVQSPDGLRIEILGVKFEPRAETVKTPAGFGVKVTLKATASEPYTLLAPKHGPMAFAGVVKRKGKEPEPFGDEREGDGEVVILPDQPATFSRTWPAKNTAGLSNNDKLELDIGLWGLGETREDGRPVKQFLRVEARVDSWRGHARIKPPPSVAGN